MLNGEAGNTQTIKIDKASGLLATELTPASYIEEKTFSDPHSILYYIDKNDPLGPIPSNPAKDPQFTLWENAVQKWAEKQASSSKTTLSNEAPPKEKDNLHTKENLPNINIIEPINNQMVDSVALVINVEAEAKRGIKKVEFLIDNIQFATKNEAPYTVTRRVDFLDNGFHNLKIIACDDIDNCSQKEVEFNLNLSNNTDKNTSASISLVSPTNGLKINKKEFPLDLLFTITNPQNVAKIEIYGGTEQDKKNIGIIQGIETETITYSLKNINSEGFYTITYEAYNWKKEKLNTGSLQLEIIK